MEGRAALSVVARNLSEETKRKKQAEAQAREQQDAKQAGLNPILHDPAVISSCLEFLETKIIEAAQNGEESVLIPYLDIPPVKDRYDKIVLISVSLAKKELHQGADYIKEQFKQKHPDFNAQSHKDRATIVPFFNNKLKITF